MDHGSCFRLYCYTDRATQHKYTLQGQYLFRCRKAEQLGEEIQKRIDAMREKYESTKHCQKRYPNSGHSGSGEGTLMRGLGGVRRGLAAALNFLTWHLV